MAPSLFFYIIYNLVYLLLIITCSLILFLLITIFHTIRLISLFQQDRNVATVEHGVPLMWSKWVHRTWAHQGGTQGQGTRLADGPPHLPHGIQMDTTSTTKAKDWGTLRGPLNPEEDIDVPGTPPPGRRPGSPPGTNLQRAMKISLPALAGSS